MSEICTCESAYLEIECLLLIVDETSPFILGDIDADALAIRQHAVAAANGCQVHVL